MSAGVDSLPDGVDKTDRSDVVDGLADDSGEDHQLTSGNTVRLAALFGNVKVGARRQKSVEEIQQVKKVTTVSRRSQGPVSDSESDSEQETRVTKVTTFTRTKTTKQQQHETSSSESEYETRQRDVSAQSVTVVKTQSKDSTHDKQEKTTIVKKIDVKKGADDRKNVKVTKEVYTSADKSKKHNQDKKHVTVITTTENASSSSSEDEIQERNKEVKTGKGNLKEKNKEKQKEKTVVKKKTIESSSQSEEDEPRQEKVVVTSKKVTVAKIKKSEDKTERRKEERRQQVTRETYETDTSDSEEPDNTKDVVVVSKKVEVGKDSGKQIKVVKREVYSSDKGQGDKRQSTKEAVVIRTAEAEYSSSSEDEGQQERTVVVKTAKGKWEEKIKEGQREGRIEKHIKNRQGAKADNDRDENTQAKVIKVTKVVNTVATSSSDEEQVTKIDWSKKKVLIISSHVTKASYEGALYRKTVKYLKSKGAEILTSNLHAATPDLLALGEDFRVTEQDKIHTADLFVIMAGIVNNGLPAILKAWFDNILADMLAYDKSNLYDNSPLKGKKVLMYLTWPGVSTMYTPRGIHGDINVYLWPIVNGILHYSGLDVLRPVVYFNPGHTSLEFLDSLLDIWKRRLDSVWIEKTLNFVPTEMYKERRGFVLSHRRLAEVSEKSYLLGPCMEGARPDIAQIVDSEASDEKKGAN